MLPFPGVLVPGEGPTLVETNVGRGRLLGKPKNYIKSTQRPQKTTFGRNLTR